MCVDLIAREFSPADWNIYCFQFSDGDNWGEDNESSLRMLRESLLPASNLFCYGQVESPYGSGEYMRALRMGIAENLDKLVLSRSVTRTRFTIRSRHFWEKENKQHFARLAGVERSD